MSEQVTVEVEPRYAGQHSCTLGCDPEFFFVNEGGEVVGAERIIPKNGLLDSSAYDRHRTGLVLDGVQVELNPMASTCRQTLSSNIQESFRNLKNHLLKHPGFKASFTSVVDIKKEELDSLSDDAKRFGCAPSLNVNGKGNEITVDAATYLKRAAGGHIHLGLSGYPQFSSPEVKADLVKVLDIVLGNTCVMIDLDEGQKVRRLHYGRAGEYRTPSHGLEYRTLSNFWLRSYQLTSLVMGLARMGVSIVGSDYKPTRPPKPHYYTELEYNRSYPIDRYAIPGVKTEPALVNKLFSYVDYEKITQAINENDLELAKKNYYEGVRPFISKYLVYSESNGLHKENLNVFDYFLEMIWENGIQFWFKDDAFEHWTGGEVVRGGWESWLMRKVRGEMEKAKAVAKLRVKEVQLELKEEKENVVESSTIENELGGIIGPAAVGPTLQVVGVEGPVRSGSSRIYVRNAQGKFAKAA